MLDALERIAPLELAESWDNVGLLIDPRPLGAEQVVERAVLTIDATPAVLRDPRLTHEACLVAYHPPLFGAVKRLDARRTPVAVEALRRGFSVYSPHTALDSVRGGLNDWLAEAFGAGEVRPIVPNASGDAGAGRLLRLDHPRPLMELVASLKRQLGLQSVRVAANEAHAAGAPISRVALAAGAGGALFEQTPGVELYVTGEMRHHDVLAKLQAGASVVLCEHSSSERGYLPRLRERLIAETGGAIEVHVSTDDREPLRVV